MAAGWVPLGKKVGVWVVKTAPAWGPTARKSAAKSRETLANREKAINQATQIDGQFAQVWLRDTQYWVVRKNAVIENSFPRCDDQEGLERSAGQLRPEAWTTPDQLLRRRAKARARQIRRKRRIDPPDSN